MNKGKMLGSMLPNNVVGNPYNNQAAVGGNGDNRMKKENFQMYLYGEKNPWNNPYPSNWQNNLYGPGYLDVCGKDFNFGELTNSN
jgi:hypothetical protein